MTSMFLPSQRSGWPSSGPAEGEDDGAGLLAGCGDVGEEAGVADGVGVG